MRTSITRALIVKYLYRVMPEDAPGDTGEWQEMFRLLNGDWSVVEWHETATGTHPSDHESVLVSDGVNVESAEVVPGFTATLEAYKETGFPAATQPTYWAHMPSPPTAYEGCRNAKEVHQRDSNGE